MTYAIPPITLPGTTTIDALAIGNHLFIYVGTPAGTPTLYRAPLWRYTTTEPDAETKRSLSVAPNPSVGAASISFSLASAEAARLAVYDVLGREVAVLHEGPTAGEIRAQTPDLPAGTYVAVLRTESRTETQRFTIVR